MERNEIAPVSLGTAPNLSQNKISKNSVNLCANSSLCLVCNASLKGLSDKERSLHCERCISNGMSSCMPSRNSGKVQDDVQVQFSTCPYCKDRCFSEREFDIHLEYCEKSVQSRVSSSVIRKENIASLPVIENTLKKPEMKKPPKKQQNMTMKSLAKMDESTQLALALSASMQPSEIPKNKRPTKSAQLKFNRPPPSLIERDRQDSQRIVADRVAVLIGKEPISVLGSSPTLPESRLSSRSSSRTRSEISSAPMEELDVSMWNLSEKLPTKDVSEFYVPFLVPPLSPFKKEVAERFRSLSQIPGYKLNSDFVRQEAVPLLFDSQASQAPEQPAASNSKPSNLMSVNCAGDSDRPKRKIIRLVSSSESEDESVPSTKPGSHMIRSRSSISRSLSVKNDAILPKSQSHSKNISEEIHNTDSNNTLVLFESSDIGSEAHEGGVLAKKNSGPSEMPLYSDFDVAAYVEELRALSKTEIDIMLGKIGVKPIAKLQAINLLANVKLHALSKSSDRRKLRRDVFHEASTAFGLKERRSCLDPKVSGEEYALPEMKTKKRKEKTKKPESDKPATKLKTAEDIRDFLTKYIIDNSDLYQDLLQYEVVYIKSFLRKLKDESGVCIKADLLMDFLDSQSIAFSQHDEGKPRQWGNKKKSPKKQS